MMLSALLAFVGTAPSGDPLLSSPQRALYAIMQRSGDGNACDGGQLHVAAASATFRRLGTLDGNDVVLAEVTNPCICGAQNCPYYVLRLAPTAPVLLFSTYGISLAVQPASPLPTLVVTAHDSALVVDTTTMAWRSGQYVEIASARVRGDTGASKPNAIPVRFAAGASSSVLRGTASIGWYDSYAFDAMKGQRVTISAVHAAAPLNVLLVAADGTLAATLTPGHPYALSKTGSYRLQVEVEADDESPYAVTLEIR
jgi:hypothetical protein